MTTFQINAGHLSRPRPVGKGQVVTINPGVGGYAQVEYTLGSMADIMNNVAVWKIWPLGVSNSAQTDAAKNNAFIRVTAVNANCSYTIDQAPSAASSLSLEPDWESLEKPMISPVTNAVEPFAGQVYGLQVKGMQEQSVSVLAGISNYSNTTRFVENWVDTTAWAKGATPFIASGGKMYAGATQGGGSNGNHSFVSASGDLLRWSIDFFLPAAAGVGSVVMGFDSSAPGATPGAGGSTASWAMEFNLAQTTGIRRYLNGSIGALAGTYPPGGGNFSVHYIKDANWLSYSLYNNDTNVEYLSGRVAQSGITINNLYIANGDPRQLTGAAISPSSARTAIQPAIAGQAGNAGRFSQYTANNSSGTVNYHIWGPANYDPRQQWPLAILFHGDGSDEQMFSTGSLLSNKDALVAAGYLVIGVGIAANKSTWGSMASTDAYFAAYQYMTTNYSIGPVVFCAVSMGGIESLNCLVAKKIPGVVAWVGISPTANLARAYATNWTAKIDTAYGITGSGQTTYALATDGFDPLLQTDIHAFQDLPMMFIAATDDTLVPRQFNTDPMKAKISATAKEIVDIPGVTGGHTFDSAPYSGQIVSFFNKYAKY